MSSQLTIQTNYHAVRRLELLLVELVADIKDTEMDSLRKTRLNHQGEEIKRHLYEILQAETP